MAENDPITIKRVALEKTLSFDNCFIGPERANNPEWRHKVKRRSYRVQMELLAKHEARETLLAISHLVEEEIVQILGAYLCDPWRRNEMFDQINEEPGRLARTIGSQVGNTVAGILAAGDGWPSEDCVSFHRREILVLTASEISMVVHLMHWMNAAAHVRRRHERECRPGWDNHWLWERLKAANCYVRGKHWSGWVADPAISYVIVKRDGSITKVGLDDSRTETGPAPTEETEVQGRPTLVPPLETRQFRPPSDPMWRHKEITHRWIEGKGWARITD
jgi:hypothetical protein